MGVTLKTIHSISINRIFTQATREIMNGATVSPKRIHTKELLAPKIILEDPQNRIVTFIDRSTDIFYAIGEFFWYLSGSNSLDHIAYYAPSIINYSDDNKTLNSAYGYNIFYKWVNQWEECKRILLSDNDSRRAIIFIREPSDLTKITKDSVCTNTMHFLIRENKLYLIVNMRSNDFYVGFIFDVFCFTMLQELMSIELNIKLGSYIHIANSLHIYENWLDVASKIVKSQLKQMIGKMKPMYFCSNVQNEIADILKYEQMIRTEPIEIIHLIEEDLYNTILISSYWTDILLVLVFKRYFSKGDYNKCKLIIKHLAYNSNNNLFAELLRRKLDVKSQKIKE